MIQPKQYVKVPLLVGDLCHTTHCALFCLIETVLYISVNKSLSTRKSRLSVLISSRFTMKIHRNTRKDIVNMTRGDIAIICKELWRSFQKAFITLYETIKIMKESEIIIIGYLLSALPKVLNFFSKTMTKIAKL